MLSIDMKFTAIIITHASAATYGPMLSPLSPLSPVFFQLDENILQELIHLWATVSAITCWQIFCNDCSIYSVVWNGITLPFFLGYHTLRSLLSTGPFTVVRALSQIIADYCPVGESIFYSMNFKYRETLSNGSANTIPISGFRRGAKVASVLNVPILIDYAETACCEAYPSSDLISNRALLTTSNGRSTSHATEIADPYDVSFGIFFDVAERGLLLQHEFLLLASCIVATLPDEVCTVHQPIIINAPKKKRVGFADEVIAFAPREHDTVETSDEERRENSSSHRAQLKANRRNAAHGVSIFGTIVRISEDPTVDYENQVEIFDEAMADSYRISSRDLGQFPGIPTATWPQKVMYNMYAVDDLLKTILNYSNQHTASRGARVESCIRRSKGTLGRDPMKWISYYCYDVGIRDSKLHKSGSGCQLEAPTQTELRQATGAKVSSLLKEMFDAYISCTSRRATYRLDYEAEFERFQRDIPFTSEDAKSEQRCIGSCINYLNHTATSISQNTEIEFVTLLRMVRAYYLFKDWFETFKNRIESQMVREENFCALIEWVSNNRHLENQHTEFMNEINLFSVGNEEQFSKDYQYYKVEWECNLPRRKVMTNNLRRSVTDLVRSIRPS